MRRDAGVVLINALVIVMVLAAVAASLLARSEGARQRAALGQAAVQMEFYLDGIEALVPELLKAAVAEGQPVHPGQSWASSRLRYAIDRGGVTARIVDLQGRLNVNWLVEPDERLVSPAFTTLFRELDLPDELLDAISEFVAPGGPRNRQPYLARPVPVLPKGGPIARVEQLAVVEGMTPAYLARLAPYITALPEDSQLNLNTIPEELLRWVLVGLPVAVVEATLEARKEGPLEDILPLQLAAADAMEPEAYETYPLERFSAQSQWFGARLTAELDGARLTRRVIYRQSLGQGAATRIELRWAEHD